MSLISPLVPVPQDRTGRAPTTCRFTRTDTHSYLIYFTCALSLQVEHRPQTTFLHPVLSWSSLCNACVCVHVMWQVVVTNQMTTMVTGDRASQQVPALGESWAHVPTQRVVLYWQNHRRHAVLYKSASVRQTDVCFQITVSGPDCQSQSQASISSETWPCPWQPIPSPPPPTFPYPISF